MKSKIILMLSVIMGMTSCNVYHETSPAQVYNMGAASPTDEINITESLFNDKEAKISEENIQKILNGKYALPQSLRVAIVNIENVQTKRYYWDNEDYLSARQKYLDIMINNLQSQTRVQTVSLIPEILLPAPATFTGIREAAVRIQADIVIVYSVNGGLYSKYKLFSAEKYKAFATTQLLVMDVRTGLVPFTEVSTKSYESQKEKSDFNDDEARRRVQEQAVTQTLDVICQSINRFLSKQ